MNPDHFWRKLIVIMTVVKPGRHIKVKYNYGRYG